MANSNSRKNSWEDRESKDERKDDRRGNKGSSNYRGKKNPKSKTRDYHGRGDKKPSIRTSRDNDAGWYYTDPQLAFDSASVSWYEPLGNHVDTIGNSPVLNLVGPGAYGDNVANHVIPGVCALEVMPGVGKSTDLTSPINVAARAIYAYNRHQNAGSTNYESADYMQYLIAMSSLYSCFNWLARIYGLTRISSQQNRYIPDSLIWANNVDANNIHANIANFRAWLNYLAVKISQFYVPSTMPYFKRQNWMFNSVFADNDIAKAQYYMYVPACFYKYVETSSTEPGYLDPVWVGPSGHNAPFTFTELRNTIEPMLEAVLHSESIGIMSGDTLKAWGAENCFVVPAIDETYTTLPVYSEEVLTQIQNARVHRIYLDAESRETYKIKQYLGDNPTDTDAATLIYNPKFLSTAPIPEKHMASIDANIVGPELNLVASRLTNVVDRNCTVEWDDEDGLFHYDLASFGSEICIGLWIMKEPNEWPLAAIHRLTSEMTIAWSNQDYDYIRSVDRSQLSTFNHHPWVRDWLAQIDEGHVDHFDAIGTYYMVDNYTMWDSNILEKMHTCALLGEFNISKLGTFGIDR